MRSEVGVLLVALGSCRSTGADPSRAQPPIRADAETAPSVTASPRASEPEPYEEPPPQPPEPAAVPQSVVPIALPFGPKAIVVERVFDASPVALFPEEASAVRHRVARMLVAKKREVVPIAELERIEAAAAEGRLVLEGDQTCKAPLTAHEVSARYYASQVQADVRAACFDDCTLTVDVSDPTDDNAYTMYKSRNVSRPHDPRAWVRAADTLRRVDEGMAGIFGLGGVSHAPPVRLEQLETIGPWPKAFDGVAIIGADVSRCAHPDPIVGVTYEVRAAVDPRGTISRCTADPLSSIARASDATCLCTKIGEVVVPPGPAGRRFRLRAIDDDGFLLPGAKLSVIQKGTDVWVDRLAQSLALERCLQQQFVQDITGVVTLALAPDGTVDDASLTGNITTMPAMQFATCLVAELRKVPLPCRPPGVDTLQVTLTIPKP